MLPQLVSLCTTQPPFTNFCSRTLASRRHNLVQDSRFLPNSISRWIPFREKRYHQPIRISGLLDPVGRRSARITYPQSRRRRYRPSPRSRSPRQPTDCSLAPARPALNARRPDAGWEDIPAFLSWLPPKVTSIRILQPISCGKQ